MKASNQIKLSFLSRSANEGFARIAVAAFAAQLDPTVEEISEIKTAVSEAVTNCIVHGYRNTLGTIYLTARIYDNGKLMTEIYYKICCGFSSRTSYYRNSYLCR